MSGGRKDSIGIFQIGDRVRLSGKGKRNFRDSPSNPYKLEGTVTKLWDYLIVIDWDSGFDNSYIDSELELVL